VSAETPATPVPPGIRRGTTYFPEIESLRGVAIALVFVFHADSALLFPFLTRTGSVPSPALAYVWSGHTGVTLFFVLSGFLLSLPFLEEAYGGRPVSVARFYARRALRILPLYYAAVIAATLATSHTVRDLWHGLPYLVFLESRPGLTTPLPPFSGVWWSLATEVQFYALLPLVALAFGRSRRVTLLVLAAYTVTSAAIAFRWIVPELQDWFRAQSILGRGPIFLFGMLAAWLWLRHGEALHGRLAASRWLVVGGGDLLLLALLVALGCLLRWATFHGFIQLEVTRAHAWHVIEGALWTGVMLVVLLVPLRTKRLLSNPVLGRLGVLSYSIYVLHQPVFTYTLAPWRRLLPETGLGWSVLAAGWFVVAALICFALATLTYRVIERPFLVRKARLDASVPPAPTSARAERSRVACP
jgi:peptidoglycan/LPS O-acetylase OafA/YrhL